MPDADPSQRDPRPQLATPDRTFDHRVRVRYGETDQMGVVHHSNYLLYLEEARTAFMASLGCSYGALERTGFGLAVRKAELRFRRPACYEDELAVLTEVAKVGPASVTFHYRLVRVSDDALIATGSTELAGIDLSAAERPLRTIPDELREVLVPLTPPEDARPSR